MSNRSQFEEYLEKQLKFHFPKAEYQFNKRDIIFDESTGKGLELDLYMDVNGVKIGIEVDGLTHKQVVFSEETFIRTQRLDAAKNNACYNAGIYLVRIDVSKMHNFSVKASRELIRDALASIKAILADNNVSAKSSTLTPLRPIQKELPDDAPF